MPPLLAKNKTPYAIISQGDQVNVYHGELMTYEYLADVPQQSVMMIPFSQVHEK